MQRSRVASRWHLQQRVVLRKCIAVSLLMEPRLLSGSQEQP